MAEENQAASAVLYWYGDNCFTKSPLANIIEELDSQGVTVPIQEGQDRDAYYTDKKTKVCGKYRSRVHKIVGTIAEAKKIADRENKKILAEEKRKQQAEEQREMSTDTNGRHKRVKKRKVDKEFSYEESDGKSSAYVDGDQEITEKNKNTTEKNTQNKKNSQKNKENQIPKQKNTSKKNKKESLDKVNSFIGAECLAQMKNQLASPAPVTLMQHPNFGTVAPQKSLSAPTTTFYHLQTTSNNLLFEKHVNVSQAPPSHQVASTVKSLPPLSVNSHPPQTPPQHLQDNTLPSYVSIPCMIYHKGCTFLSDSVSIKRIHMSIKYQW